METSSSAELCARAECLEQTQLQAGKPQNHSNSSGDPSSHTIGVGWSAAAWGSPCFSNSPLPPCIKFLNALPCLWLLSFRGGVWRKTGLGRQPAAATSLQGETHLKSEEVRSVLPKDVFRGSYARSALLHPLLFAFLIFLFHSFNSFFLSPALCLLTQLSNPTVRA